MPLFTSDALILRTYTLGEADRIVVFLTRDRGKKRGVARGARRARSRFVGALEPLTRVRVAYFEKERRELVSLNYAEVGRSPLAAREGSGLGHVGYFAELIDEWAPDAHADERLYRLGAAVTDALAAGIPVEPLARYFEYWLLLLQGVYPSLAACHRCGEPFAEDAVFLSRGDRVFVCERCAPLPVGAPDVGEAGLTCESLGFLRVARRTAPERIGGLTLSERASRELESVHRALITAHLEKELRSARVLRSLKR
jgi:DNA repair protein RecO (recombination protein O)